VRIFWSRCLNPFDIGLFESSSFIVVTSKWLILTH
jgi:hypothetical protein